MSLPIICIGGWAANAAMLAPIFAHWPASVSFVSLDTLTLNYAATVDELAQQLLCQHPEPALWVGWSLGGQVAMAAAMQSPEQVLAVVTLCAFPRFTATAGWPYGMPEDRFQQFSQRMRTDTLRNWKRFLMLQIAGAADPKRARDELKPWLAEGPPADQLRLARSLAWLATSDQRAHWEKVTVPCLHLWGEQDHLVSPLVASQNYANRTQAAVIPGMTHWPRAEAATLCRREIKHFCEPFHQIARAVV